MKDTCRGTLTKAKQSKAKQLTKATHSVVLVAALKFVVDVKLSRVVQECF